MAGTDTKELPGLVPWADRPEMAEPGGQGTVSVVGQLLSVLCKLCPFSSRCSTLTDEGTDAQCLRPWALTPHLPGLCAWNSPQPEPPLRGQISGTIELGLGPRDLIVACGPEQQGNLFSFSPWAGSCS